MTSRALGFVLMPSSRRYCGGRLVREQRIVVLAFFGYTQALTIPVWRARYAVRAKTN